MFNYIIENVKRRTSTWSAKYLSTAGKEIMIKSVALSMPVYAMSCFKLPMGVISEIENLLMRFWWEKSENNRGIPWIAWKRLQYSKKEGGLGFKDLAKFNDALLAKQAWRIIKHPHSLFARIMKARYFCDDELLNAKKRTNQSYGWASILAGLDIIKKGSRYIIGDGNTARLGIDNIIPCHPPKPIRSRDVDSNPYFREFISNMGSYRFWNNNLLSNHVNQEDHNSLKQIHLPQLLLPDKLVWHYNKSGEYSVRSGYWFSTHEPRYLGIRPEAPHGSPAMKTSIWKLSTLPKIKHFIWRVLSKALPTTTRLNARGMKLDPKCPRCCRENETINHVLFTCPYATMIWRLSNIGLSALQSPSQDCDANILSVLDLQKMQGLTSDQKLLPLWLLWRIWKSRNNYIFNKVRESPSIVVLQSKAEVREWISNNQVDRPQGQTKTGHQMDQRWQRPQEGFIKCNYDAGFDPLTHKTTGGWILRDYNGVAKGWGASRLGTSISPLEAEAKALLMAMQQAWLRGISTITFEGDCEILSKIINRTSIDISIDGICQDIFLWTTRFFNAKFVFVKRNCNKTAHCLAKFGCINSDLFADNLYPPVWLTEHLYHDLSD